MDRSAKVTWLLEELELPYLIKTLNYDKKENLSPEYLKLNPLGLVPTLVDATNKALFESNAICLALAEQDPQQRFWVQNIQERAELYQWMFFGAASLELYMSEMHVVEELDKNFQNNENWQYYSDLLTRALTMLNTHLGKHSYIMGDRFTVADIGVSYDLKWKALRSRVSDFPAVANYVERLKQRPAAQRCRVFEIK